MMRTYILIVSNNVSTVSKVHNAVMAFTAEEAVEKMHQMAYDVIAVDEAITADEKQMLNAIIKLQQEDAILVSFVNTRDADAKITAALEKQKQAMKPTYNLVDNGFRNHFLYANDKTI